jgi:tetratricopeptide (TPR) repeat protein
MKSASLLAALSALLVLAHPAPVHAFRDEPSPHARAVARKAYQHALELYDAGKYREAATELRKAYELAPLPPILFNLGVTYRKLGNRAAARAAFREYLARMPNATNRAEVEQMLAELGGGADPTQAPPPPEAGPPVEAAPDDHENPLVEARPGAPAAHNEPAVQGSSASTGHLGLWKWMAAGASAAALTVGALMLVQASDQADSLRAASPPGGAPPTQRYTSDLRAIEDGYALNRTWGTVLLVSGGVAMATSVTLFILDRREPTSRRALITPLIGPGVAAIGATGTF